MGEKGNSVACQQHKVFVICAGTNPFIPLTMQPQPRPRGRPRKKRRTGDRVVRAQSPAPAPTSSHTRHLDEDVVSDAFLSHKPNVDRGNGPSSPHELDKANTASSPYELDKADAISLLHEMDEVDAASRLSDCPSDNDTGDSRLWNPHVGLKPSPLDGCASEGEITMEDDLPYGAKKAVVKSMVDLMNHLGDADERDREWLPAEEQRKLDARKRGMSYFIPSISRALTLISREEESSFPWSRYRCEI